MIKQRIVQGLAAGMMAATLLCGASVQDVEASAVGRAAEEQAARSVGEETISPQSDRLVWVMKEEDGKLYRRLYNASTGKWMTDWILCG